jgi:predicted HD superfamily hydrolase involved in NAD metabolism
MVYMNISEIEKKLQENLKPERYRHTLGVAYTAANMAAVFGVSAQKAYRAGLLHDCAKGYSLDEQKLLCRKYEINLEGAMTDSPQLMHQALAPHIAWELYREEDEEVLEAIECHTTGKPAMTPMDKIVFIADYMEPNRRMIPGLDRVRKLAFQDLDACILRILENTIGYLESRGMKIGSRTIETYEYYKA